MIAPNHHLYFRKYPSTTALQCFETAARHLSFTRAAQELHMTQSAVSKQVAQLEEMLNLPLFYRTSHRISLTPAGKRYYLEVLEILKLIESATTSLMAHNENEETLRMTSHPTFCARWLIPVLRGFDATYPLINMELREQVGPFFSQGTDVDVAFLYGDGVWSGMESLKLFDEYCVAVCHPDYLKTHVQCSNHQHSQHTPTTQEEIDEYTLLHISSRPSAWYDYFRQQDIAIDGTFVGPKFDTFYACISAALAEYGIALVPKRLVEPELQRGKLVIAWDYESKSRGSYYLSYPATLGNTHKIRAIIDWITDYLDSESDHLNE